MIADRYDVALSDNAVCHRNLNLGDSQCVFISTRLMDDKFSVAFEFYINVGHALVDRAGVSGDFAELAWSQVEAGARGETSLDAFEARKLATAGGPDAERFKNEYLEATFSDTISIYLLSLYLDVDYHDLRERDYPLLTPSALAERLRKVAELFPPNSGFDFADPLQAAVTFRRRFRRSTQINRKPRSFSSAFLVSNSRLRLAAKCLSVCPLTMWPSAKIWRSDSSRILAST